MKLPGLIKVVRQGGVAFVEIDSKAFPYAIAENGITVDVDRRECPTVTVTLMAERVEVHNSLDLGD